MTVEEAEVKLNTTIKEINAAGYAVLTSVLFEDGYRLEEVTADGSSVVKRDDEPFRS